MPLSAEELVNALHEAASAKNVDNFVAVAGVLEDQVDETFVQQKKGQLRRVIKLYRQIQKEQEQDATPREIARAMEALGKKIKSFTTPAAAAPPPAPPRSQAPPPRADGPPAALSPVPTGTPLATLARRRPLAAAERDARLRTVAQRLERQGIPSSLNNTVRSSDIKHMFFAVDEVFLGGALKEHLKGTRDDLDRLVASASNRMTSTIYKFEYRQGIVVVTFSAAMLWKQDYARGGAHVCRVPCQNRRDTMTLLVMVAAGRLAASHCGTDKDATALSLFGLPRSQEIISMPPPPRAAARASGVGVGSNVAFTDRAGQRLVGSVKSIRKNAQVLVPDPTKRGEIYTIKSSGRRVHYAKWNISLNLLSPATAQDMARHAEQEKAAEAVSFAAALSFAATTAAKDWLPPKAEPVPVSPAPPASSGSVDEEGLRALKRLHDDGIIDDEEFASKKKKCLGI